MNRFCILFVLLLSACMAPQPRPQPVSQENGKISVVNERGFAVNFPNGEYFVPQDSARDTVVSSDCRVVVVMSRNFENWTDETRSALDILVASPQKLEKHIHLPGLWLSPNFNAANTKIVVRKSLTDDLYQIVVFDIQSQKLDVIAITDRAFNVTWLGDDIAIESFSGDQHKFFVLTLAGELSETEEIDSTYFRYQPAITSQQCTPQEKE